MRASGELDESRNELTVDHLLIFDDFYFCTRQLDFFPMY